MPAQSVPAPADHPLMQFQPESPKNWYYWTEEWKAAGSSHALRQGLIRTGFDTSSPEWLDTIHTGERICFYLELADSWYNGFEGKGNDTVTANRKELSRLALIALSEKFFRNTEPDHRVPSWADKLDLDGVIEKLLWFFRSEGRPPWIANLGPGNSSLPNQALPRFLKDFVDYLWLGHKVGTASTSKAFQPFRPQLITILASTNRLNILLDTQYELDEPCWLALQALASSEHPGGTGVSLEREYFEAKRRVARDAAHVLIMRGIQRDLQARADDYKALLQEMQVR